MLSLSGICRAARKNIHYAFVREYLYISQPFEDGAMWRIVHIVSDELKLKSFQNFEAANSEYAAIKAAASWGAGLISLEIVEVDVAASIQRSV